jgi:hypothetical protein
MSKRTDDIISAVVARSGSIAPYDDFDAFVSDVKHAKVKVESLGLPAQVVFTRMLVRCATEWAIKRFDLGVYKGRIYVVKLLQGMPGAKLNANMVGALLSYGRLILEVEKRIAQGSLPEHAMPGRIYHVMFAPFKRLDLDSQISVLKLVSSRMKRPGDIRAAFYEAYPRAYVEDFAGTTEADQIYAEIKKVAEKRGFPIDIEFFKGAQFEDALAMHNGVYDFEELELEEEL